MIAAWPGDTRPIWQQALEQRELEQRELRRAEREKRRGRGRDYGLRMIPLEKRREYSSLGGRKAHALGLAHEWTKTEAREAGRKGGLAVQAAKRAARGES